MSKKPAVIVEANQGPALAVVGDSYRIVISGEETNGAYAVIDMLVPPGGGPGPHAHPGFQESFHVLEGAIELTTEKGTYTAKKAISCISPKGGSFISLKNKPTRQRASGVWWCRPDWMHFSRK